MLSSKYKNNKTSDTKLVYLYSNAILFASLHKIVLSHIFSIQKETNTRKLVELRKTLLDIKNKNKLQIPLVPFIL